VKALPQRAQGFTEDFKLRNRQINMITMLNNVLAGFYEKDLRKLIEEINSFKNEVDLWRTTGSIKNSTGNLVLHIIGGMNYLIGTTLAQTGYTRNREQEFVRKDVEKKELITQLEELIVVISKTLNSFCEEDMKADYPMIFDDAIRSNSYVLTQLLLHLNYHLGQANYLRRYFE
jgi:hypothetical protein